MHWFKFAVVTGVTALRILVIPGLVYYRDQLDHFTTLLLLGLATGFIDGRLARYWNVTSLFGERFDDVADGLILCSAAFLLWWMNFVPAIALIVYVVGCLILVAMIEGPGQRYLPVRVRARIGLSWFWFAVVLDGTIITSLVWMSYSTSVATVLTGIGMLCLWRLLVGPIGWRDQYESALATDTRSESREGGLDA